MRKVSLTGLLCNGSAFFHSFDSHETMTFLLNFQMTYNSCGNSYLKIVFVCRAIQCMQCVYPPRASKTQSSRPTHALTVLAKEVMRRPTHSYSSRSCSLMCCFVFVRCRLSRRACAAHALLVRLSMTSRKHPKSDCEPRETPQRGSQRTHNATLTVACGRRI